MRGDNKGENSASIRMSRYDLTDFEWRAIEPLLPNKPRGVLRVDDRRVLNGIFWVLRSGAPWRNLPERYGPRTTCYNRFARWRKAGVWDMHFRNKEHLVAEALSAAGTKTIATLGRSIAKGGINAAVDGSLSISHRDSATPICPFAALGSEMVRSGDEAKASATAVMDRLFATL